MYKEAGLKPREARCDGLPARPEKAEMCARFGRAGRTRSRPRFRLGCHTVWRSWAAARFAAASGFGFREEPDIPQARKSCEARSLSFSPMETRSCRPRERIFAAMAHNAASAMHLFKLPASRVVERGTPIDTLFR
ncbi:MAG: hypothetical protein ACLGHA_04385 [Gammaproteobacteria bacterium]